jgi:hypothetical protein
MAIHAAKRDTREERGFWCDNVPGWDAEGEFAKIGIVCYDALPRGVILGTMIFDVVLPSEQARILRTIEEETWGNYADGRYAWHRKDALLLPTPIPCVGQQGIFEWGPP